MIWGALFVGLLLVAVVFVAGLVMQAPLASVIGTAIVIGIIAFSLIVAIDLATQAIDRHHL